LLKLDRDDFVECFVGLKVDSWCWGEEVGGGGEAGLGGGNGSNFPSLLGGSGSTDEPILSRTVEIAS